MPRGFTLIEMLLVLLLTGLLLTAIPVRQQMDARVILAKEQQHLYLFLRQIQARAENSAAIWFLSANRNSADGTWCFTAQIKSGTVCDCLNPSRCPPDVNARFYTPRFPKQTQITAEKWYPLELARFSGTRNTIVANCFVLVAAKYRTLFTFFNVGTINMKTADAASACNKAE